MKWSHTHHSTACIHRSFSIRMYLPKPSATSRMWHKVNLKIIWVLHNDAMYGFEQKLATAPYKTAAVWPLTSHLTNHPSKTCWSLLMNLRRTHKRRTSIDSFTCILQCWPTSYNLYSSAQYGHSMPSRRLYKTLTDWGGWYSELSFSLTGSLTKSKSKEFSLPYYLSIPGGVEKIDTCLSLWHQYEVKTGWSRIWTRVTDF